MKTIFPDKTELTNQVIKNLFENHAAIHNDKQKRPESVEERKYAFTLLICLNVEMEMECSVVGLL